MKPRTRLNITMMALCHLLLLVQVAYCQLPQQTKDDQTAPTLAKDLPIPPLLPADEVTIRAQLQEKDGNIFRLKGDAEVTYRNYVIRADEITYNEQTGDIAGNGGVVFDGGPHDSHVEASRAIYNIHTENGTFYDVTGSLGTRLRGRNVVLTTSNPFMFSGKEVRKIGRDRFIVLHGTVTSCQLPTPKWTFNTEKADVIAGEDAKLYHSTFRILNIPILYFPYASHPVDNIGRRTGFLLPTIGQSSRKGFIFGDSLYWAINRSMDTSIGAEYYSQRGWAQHGEFRARPSENSFVNFNYFGVLDRGDPVTQQDQGGQDIKLVSELELPWGFRGVANVNYLSSFLFRAAFSESFTQAVNSEVKSVAFVSKNVNGFSFDVMSSRYQNFQSTTQGDRILLIHAPTVEASTVERRFLNTRFVYAADATVEGVSRREPDFVTANLVGRVDLHPRAALPLFFKGWSVRPEVALRETYYSQRQIPTEEAVGIPNGDPLDRRAVEASIEVRPPALSKVFEREVRGRKIKHVIEPRFAYNYVSGVDNIREIIRFDSRDILSNTSEFEAGITQRWYGKRTVVQRDPLCDYVSKEPPAGGPQDPEQPMPGTTAELKCDQDASGTRELLSWEVKAKYFLNPDFGGAVIAGRRNVLSTTSEFTGIAFLTEPRNWSPVVSRLRVQANANTDIQWQLDYDAKKGRINSSTALVDYRFREFFVGGSQAFLHVPGEIVTTSSQMAVAAEAPDLFNQFRVLAGYGHPGKRGLSAAASIGFDAHLDFMQTGSVQTSYNWDCCGLSVEYRRFALGAVRNENQFRFAFTLANVGTFGNLRRQERLF